MSIVSQGVIQQKLNENYMRQYYEGLLGSDYKDVIDPNNFRKYHSEVKRVTPLTNGEIVKGLREKYVVKDIDEENEEIETDKSKLKGRKSSFIDSILEPEEPKKVQKIFKDKLSKLRIWYFLAYIDNKNDNKIQSLEENVGLFKHTVVDKMEKMEKRQAETLDVIKQILFNKLNNTQPLAKEDNNNSNAFNEAANKTGFTNKLMRASQINPIHSSQIDYSKELEFLNNIKGNLSSIRKKSEINSDNKNSKDKSRRESYKSGKNSSTISSQVSSINIQSKEEEEEESEEEETNEHISYVQNKVRNFKLRKYTDEINAAVGRTNIYK